ncbi:MarR family transcriptional regulator, partial [Streptomyces sp. NPDC001732]
MDIKSLAKNLPLYGQMAVGSALQALGVAGHLRLVRCLSGEGGGRVRWVTRTFWSRVAHDNEWWDAFLAAEERRPAPQEAAGAVEVAEVAEAVAPVPVPAQPPVPPVAAVPQQRTVEPQPQPQPQPGAGAGPSRPGGSPSPAFLALAGLGRADARLALSAADCAALE